MSLSLIRLVLLGGRGAWPRMFAIAGGVAVGIALLVLLLGASGGIQVRDARSAWLNPKGTPAVVDGAASPVPDHSLLFTSSTDVFNSRQIEVRTVAASSADALNLPDGIATPKPGSYYASPTMIRLIKSSPADELGERYGTFTGELPASALKSPDALVVVAGREPSWVQRQSGASIVTSFDDTAPSSDSALTTVMIIGGIAVFFPVLLFISIVTQLGAAQRQERFSTLRLMGATPRVVSQLAAFEMLACTFAGAIIGVVIAFFVRPLVAHISVADATFYPSDLALSPIATAVIVIAISIVAAAVASRRIRRAGIGPLGTTRQQREKTPRSWRVIPLVLGLIAMIVATVCGQSGAISGSAVSLLLIGGFLLIAFGLVIIGPWTTLLLSRLLSRNAGTAESVIAISRIQATPRAMFRSVSGLVIAVLMVTVFAGVASTANQATEPPRGAGFAPADTLFATLAPGQAIAATFNALAQTPGVSAVIPAYAPATGSGVLVATPDARRLRFTDIPSTPYATFDSSAYLSTSSGASPATLTSAEHKPAAGTEIAVFVSTDGAQASIERARTVLDKSESTTMAAITRSDLADLGTVELVNSLALLAYLGGFFAVAVAGISLAVATAAAILDRKRAFGLMRLAGMPVTSLRRIITLESAVPLASVLIATMALGFLVAWLIVHGLTNNLTMTWPDPRYWITLAIGFLLAVGAITVAAIGIKKNTAISSTRFE